MMSTHVRSSICIFLDDKMDEEDEDGMYMQTQVVI